LKTDTIYYQLFKRFPSLIFTLVEHQPERAREYRFESIEVKETSYRIDGVFLPPEGASPKIVYFAEVQVRFVCPKGGKPLRMGSMGSYL
jgi:predicted transposase YdaD